MVDLSAEDINRITLLIESKANRLTYLSDEEYRSILASAVSAVLGPKGCSIRQKYDATKRLYAKLKGLDILQPLMDDPHVTDILVNGAADIFYEKHGKLSRFDERFTDNDHLMDLIHRLFDSVGKTISEKDPIADITMKDGSRANAVLKTIAVNGPVLSIRKFTGIRPDMDSLVSCGFITEYQAGFLAESVTAGRNIFISGGTGTGKTTFLNALSAYIPDSERVILIEDSPELCFSNTPDIVRLQTRNAFADRSGVISMSDLIRCALRMRPDRIIVGEVRGREASDMLWAMNTGHKGSLSTGHSNSAADMLSRLSIMVRQADDVPPDIINLRIASAIDVIVHLQRSSSGKRYVSDVVTVRDYHEGRFICESL